jgi:predicted  nucleic acid-binding Zn-ribbon protein
LRDELAAVATEIWSDGLRTGALGAENELNALRQALTETSARVDAFEDRINQGSSDLMAANSTSRISSIS